MWFAKGSRALGEDGMRARAESPDLLDNGHSQVIDMSGVLREH